MSKVKDYRIGFNPTTKRGLIEFRTETSPAMHKLQNLTADEFNAIASVLASGEAYAAGQWIHSGVESLSEKLKSVSSFKMPPAED